MYNITDLQLDIIPATPYTLPDSEEIMFLTSSAGYLAHNLPHRLASEGRGLVLFSEMARSLPELRREASVYLDLMRLRVTAYGVGRGSGSHSDGCTT